MPSVTNDLHLLSKLWLRKSIALQSLDKYEESLKCVDKALGMNLKSFSEFESLRDGIVSTLINQTSKLYAIPPKPIPLTNEKVASIITLILVSKADIDQITPILEEVIRQRAWLDQYDENMNNIMWAISQAALMRESEPELDGNDVFSLLELMITQGGSFAEQRFSQIRNKTPLQLFSMIGALECVSLLLKHGACVHTLDDDGWSPLLVAVAPNGPSSQNNSDIVRLLLSCGSNVNHSSKTGLTPLAAAAQSNDIKSVQLLLAAGASITQRCALGFSPIIWSKIGLSSLLRQHKVANDPQSLAQTPYLAIINHANQSAKDEVKYEIQQDIRCYELAKFIQTVKAYVTSIGPDSSPKDVTRKVFAYLLNAFSLNSLEKISKKFDENMTLSYALYLCVQTITPIILRKKWVKSIVSSPTSALDLSIDESIKSASVLEQSWLKIIVSAVNGPNSGSELPNDGKSDQNQTDSGINDISIVTSLNSSLSSNEELSFYYMKAIDDYIELILDPIVAAVGSTIPTHDSIQEILKISSNFICLMYSDVTMKESSNTNSDEVDALDVLKPYQEEGSNIWIHLLKRNNATVKSVYYSFDGDGLSNIDDINTSIDPSESNSDPVLLLVISDLIIKDNSATEEDLTLTADKILSAYQGSRIIVISTYPVDEDSIPLFNRNELNQLIDKFNNIFINKLIVMFKQELTIHIPSWLWEDSNISVFSRIEAE